MKIFMVYETNIMGGFEAGTKNFVMAETSKEALDMVLKHYSLDPEDKDNSYELKSREDTTAELENISGSIVTLDVEDNAIVEIMGYGQIDLNRVVKQ